MILMKKSKYVIILLAGILVLIFVLSVSYNTDSSGMPCEDPESFKKWYETYEETQKQIVLKVSITDKETIEELIEKTTDEYSEECTEEVEETFLSTEETLTESSSEDVTTEDESEQETTEKEEETTEEESGSSRSDETSGESWSQYESEDCYTSSEEDYEGETYEEEEVIPYVSPTIPHYSVNGSVLDLGLQDYIYTTLSNDGCEWMYTLVLCQAYQESRYNQGSRNYHEDGTVDVGIMQIKSKYHQYLSSKYGVPGCDLYNDSYLNIYVGVNLLKDYWFQCFDINAALSAYNTGSVTSYNPAYVNQVRQWESTVLRIY